MSLPKFAPSLIPLGSRTWTSVCLHWSVHFPELKLYLHLGDCDTHPQAQDLRCLKSQLFSPTCSRNPMVPLAQAGGCRALPPPPGPDSTGAKSRTQVSAHQS